jgi:hypothetical protein
VIEDFRENFTLITCYYSWHWIMGQCNEYIAQNRADHFYRKVESLLKVDGRFAIQHLYTNDTMPEITTIAIEAMRRSGISCIEAMSMDAYRKRRAHSWRIPDSLTSVGHSFSQFRRTTPETSLIHEFLSGSTSWHWESLENIWPLWKSVNLPVIFPELTPEDSDVLQEVFKDVLTEQTLQSLGIRCIKLDNTQYIRLSVRSAHEIIRRSSCRHRKNRRVGLRPDLPNQVRSKLAENISNLEFNEPWFVSEGTLTLNDNVQDKETQSLLAVVEPIVNCVTSTTARVFSINLRQASITDGNSIGQMRNIGPTPDDASNIREDGDWLRELKHTGIPTISEVVLSASDNPPEVIVFVGSPWNNHIDWDIFIHNQLHNREDSQPKSVVVLWVSSSKKPLGRTSFAPGNDVYADYLTEVTGWHEKPDIVDFLHFLLGQLRDDTRSVFLATSNSSIQGDTKRRDSVSITLFQNQHQYNRAKRFPEISDCFILIDALQELALIGERIRSRQLGARKVISASSHEQKQIIDFIFGSLFDQRLADWFDINAKEKSTLDKMGTILINPLYEECVSEMRLVPSFRMLKAARIYFALWGGDRHYLKDQLYLTDKLLPLDPVISNWAISRAAEVTALSDVRNIPLETVSDWSWLRNKWLNTIDSRTRQISWTMLSSQNLLMRQPGPDDITTTTKQLWFLRAFIAMLSNGLKNCAVNQTINCSASYNENSTRLKISVLNQMQSTGHRTPKQNGTQAVMYACAELFGARQPVAVRFCSCNSNGEASRDDLAHTHWISEMIFPIATNSGESDWLRVGDP